MKKIKLSDGREITVKEPTVKMMKSASKRDGDIEQTATLISLATGISEDEIDEMSLADFMLLQGAIGDFLSKAGVAVPQMK